VLGTRSIAGSSCPVRRSPPRNDSLDAPCRLMGWRGRRDRHTALPPSSLQKTSSLQKIFLRRVQNAGSGRQYKDKG
jgi:hypothetical protein